MKKKKKNVPKGLAFYYRFLKLLNFNSESNDEYDENMFFLVHKCTVHCRPKPTSSDHKSILHIY